MFEEAARLIRQMDGVLDRADLDRRTRVLRAYQLANQISDVLHPFRVECEWRISPWPNVELALGHERLKHEEKVNDILDSLASGAVPNWCLEWCRTNNRAAQTETLVTIDGSCSNNE